MPTLSFASDVPEYKIKASFIYNFARFTQWPDDNNELRICIFGKDPFGFHADDLNGKKINNKTIKVVRTRLIDEVKSCNIVFLNIIPPERHLFERALNKIKGGNILTIADADNVVSFGVMIGLIIEDNKIGFKINNTAIQASDLKISSQLLSLAKEVI
ncbi:MAG: YfiR family protein [Proteobacteria bacterium]|nr:YfiR family protein [Pseudomonadota bacterium]